MCNVQLVQIIICHIHILLYICLKHSALVLLRLLDIEKGRQVQQEAGETEAKWGLYSVKRDLLCWVRYDTEELPCTGPSVMTDGGAPSCYIIWAEGGILNFCSTILKNTHLIASRYMSYFVVSPHSLTTNDSMDGWMGV